MRKAVLDHQLKNTHTVSVKQRRKQRKKKQSKQKKRRRHLQRTPFFQFLFLGILVIGLWQFFTLPFWYIQDVDIRGLSRYNSRFVLNYLHNQNFKGQHLLLVNPLEIRATMLNFSLLEDIRIGRVLWPSRLTMDVVDRIPMFRLYLASDKEGHYQENRSIFIDKSGMVLPLPVETQPEKSLLLGIDKPLTDKQISSEMLDAIYRLNTYYETGKIKIPGYFNLTNLNNIILHAPDSSVPVWLGTLDDLPIKIDLKETLEKMIDKESQPVRYIDLRFWKNPVLKVYRAGDQKIFSAPNTDL